MEDFVCDRPKADRTVFVKAFAIIASLALAIPEILSGQSTVSPARLPLSAVYDALREGNPRIQAAEALARAAHARISSAGLPPDPQVQLGWMNYELPSLKPMEIVGMTQLQVMQMLPIGGKLGLSRSIARSRAAAQSARAQDSWWEVRAKAAMPFYEIYRADQSLAVMRETLGLLSNIGAIADVMYRVGDGNQIDVLRAQVEIARMSEDTIRMQAMRIGMAARLNAILDRSQQSPLPQPILPQFPKTLPSLEVLEQRAYSGRPMLRAGTSELDAAQSMERLARKEIIPDLQIGVQYAQRGNAGAGGEMAGASRGTERMGSLMIGANLPIFARSRQFKMRDEAAAMRQMAEWDLGVMRADTRSDLGERYSDLERSRRLAALYRNTILPQARAAVASALSAYRVGKIDFMTLLDNQMTVNKYSQELFALEAEEGQAWAELEMLIGSELVGTELTR